MPMFTTLRIGLPVWPCHSRAPWAPPGPGAGPADADVPAVANRPARMALPLAGPQAIGERRHPVEHLVHLGHDVLTVDLDRRVARRAQRDVEHRATLGHVD